MQIEIIKYFGTHFRRIGTSTDMKNELHLILIRAQPLWKYGAIDVLENLFILQIDTGSLVVLVIGFALEIIHCDDVHESIFV